MQINTSRKWHHLACDPDDLKRFTFPCTLMIALWDAATRGHWRKESVSVVGGVFVNVSGENAGTVHADDSFYRDMCRYYKADTGF